MYLLHFIFLKKNELLFSIQSINYLKLLLFILEAKKLLMLINTSLKCYTFTKVNFLSLIENLVQKARVAFNRPIWIC